jgi:hypothetical protein
MSGVPLTLLLAALAAAAPPVYTGCSHRHQVRPAEIVIACADANFYVNRLRWTRWGSRDAVAAGTAHENDCTPYCAAGHFHAYPATLRLSQPVTCVKGRREFARIGWRFTAAKPAGVPRSGSFALSCSFLRLHP